MRNILFLDDNEARHEQFIDFTEVITNNKPWDGLVRHVYNYEDAERLLNTYKNWEVLFLDHDLGEEDQMCIPGVNNKARTGSDLADLIVKSDILVKMIVLHSFNPIGRRRMSQILQRKFDKIYEVPFGYPYPIQVINLIKGEL